MDKRKQSSPERVNGRFSKRRRQTPSVSPDESIDSPIIESGQRLLKAILEAADRKGNEIAEAFKTLPSKRDLPDYYKVIKKPIALDNIESKLKNYSSFSELLDDLELMISNAQQYNRQNSVVYASSIKIKNIFTKYVAETNLNVDEAHEPRLGRTPRTTANTAVPTADEVEQREALLSVVKELQEVKDTNGYGAADHFLELPPKRTYPDYYEMIKIPISITQIRRKLKKDEYRGPAMIDDFELDILRMFMNAENYNEEGSEILDDVKRLKTFFQPRMAQERIRFGKSPLDKSKIEALGRREPAGLKIKLNVNSSEPNGTKINGKGTPTTEPESNQRATIEEVTSSFRSVTRSPTKQAISMSKSVQSPTPMDIDSKPTLSRVASQGESASPAPSAHTGKSAMSPPVAPRPAVASPKPGLITQTSTDSVNSAIATPNFANAVPIPSVIVPKPKKHPDFFEIKQRAPGRTASDSPILYIHIQSSPRIKPRERFDMTIPADEKHFFSSHTMHLTSDNNLLIITAHMNPRIVGKQTKSSTWANLNGIRVQSVENAYPQEGGLYSWEFHLNRGTTNNIECTSSMLFTDENKSDGTPDIEKAQFLFFVYVQPK